uniref:DUF7695 domain-containing protein n=1 Tax=viral metagenome TaxID=1070528 RepID=A0A6M3XZN9_9ZZZZ
MAGGIKIRCLVCGDIIQSMHRHDFVPCSCGAIFVDGGNDYTRIGYPVGKMEDHIEYIAGESENETKGG